MAHGLGPMSWEEAKTKTLQGQFPESKGQKYYSNFVLCVCVSVSLKLGSLLLNMEKALQCDPEFLSPGNLSGQPLTFNGVHDVALLEVSQFGFLHHHCKTKHFSEASWAASRCLHLTSLKFNIISLPAPILAT